LRAADQAAGVETGEFRHHDVEEDQIDRLASITAIPARPFSASTTR